MAPRRSQRRAADEDEDEDDRSMDVDGEEDAAALSGGAVGDVTRRANQLVRLALFYEQKRMMIRRDDITKKVMTGSKSFAEVFKKAQLILSETFGMELVEMKSHSADDGGGPDEELDEARKATGQKKKATSGSKSFILRSKLDSSLIDAALEPDDDVLEAEKKDAKRANVGVSEEDQVSPSGTLIAHTEPGPAAVTHVILALILVSGRTIGDAELRSYLKKLRLTNVPFSSRSVNPSVPIDTYLGNLLKQGYLDRNSLADASKKTGKGGKSKRVRADDGEGNGPKFEWRWGLRAHSEVGEDGIGQFVAEFMIGDPEEDRGREKERQKRVEKMKTGIGRAAGHALEPFS